MSHHKDPLDLLLDAIFDQIFDAEWTGRHGEKLTAKQLKRLAFFMGEGKVLRNVYVPKEGGGTSEIDVLFITSRGVFVIESKNYSGWIFGNEADRYWTQCLEGGQRNRFYNPIWQNRGHVKWLGRYVGEDVPLHSLVVFSERCELKKVTVESEGVTVIKRDELGRTVRRIWEGAESAGPVDVDGVYRRFEPLTHADAATRATHVEEARAAATRGSGRTGVVKEGASRSRRAGSNHAAAESSTPEGIATGAEEPRVQTPCFDGASSEATDPAAEQAAAGAADAAPRCTATVGSASTSAAVSETMSEAAPASKGEPEPAFAPEPASEAAPAEMSDSVQTPASDSAPVSPLCPRCGKPLVVRTARRGANAGGRFYGCTGYPSCRYTRSL